jgi:glutaredoxin-like protein
MAIFDENITKQLRDILALMKDEVSLVFFSQEIECLICRETGEFLKEITSLNNKMKLVRYDLVKDSGQAARYRVDKIPAILLLDKDGQDLGVCFYGPPGGYEINSFLGAILEASGMREAYPPEIAARVRAIDKPVHIQVFVSLTCPYCPGSVMAAHRLAMENRNVRADMIDVGVFPHLAVLHNITGVPKTLVNGQVELPGEQPPAALLDAIDQIGKPAPQAEKPEGA